MLNVLGYCLRRLRHTLTMLRMPKTVQWIIAFVSSYLLISILGAALWSSLTLGVQFAIAIPLSLFAAGVVMRSKEHKARQ